MKDAKVSRKTIYLPIVRIYVTSVRLKHIYHNASDDMLEESDIIYMWICSYVTSECRIRRFQVL